MGSSAQPIVGRHGGKGALMQISFKTEISVPLFIVYRQIEIYITPTLGDYRLCDITPRLIRQWANAVRDTYALSSARQALAILKRTLGLAFDEKLIDFNPAASVRLGLPARASPARSDEENGRALSADQVTKLLNEARPEQYYAQLRAARHVPGTRSLSFPRPAGNSDYALA